MVRLLDRERHDLRIGRVVPDQRDVGSMQRRDDLRGFTVPSRGQHLPRQVGGGGVRDRVMGVDDVEAEVPRHLHDLVGEGQQVLRLAEQRIAWRQHAVKREAGLKLAQPKRRLGADEVDGMPPMGEGLAQLRGDDTAAADRGVADHPDVHGCSRSSRRCGRSIVCLTTKPSAKATPICAPKSASRLSMSWRNRTEVSLV